MSNIHNIKFLEHKRNDHLENIFYGIAPDNYLTFNPSFYVNDIMRVFSYRSISLDTHIPHHKLSEPESFINVNGVVTNISDIAKKMNLKRLIDPKIFKLGSDLYITMNTGWCMGGNDIYVMKIFPTIGTPKKVVFKNRKEQERNWAFFNTWDCAENVYCMYSIDPLILLKRTEETENEWIFDLEYTRTVKRLRDDLTIGTQLHKHDGKLHFIAHQKETYKDKKIYFGRHMTLDPYGKCVEHVSGDSLVDSLEGLIDSEPKYNNKLYSCTYFSGISTIDDNLVVGYGINDLYYGFANI